MTTTLDNGILTGSDAGPVPAFTVLPAGRRELDALHALRREVFVGEQGVFDHSDRDEVDEDPRTVSLVALATDGQVLGGVRVHPALRGADIGWWRGSRLAVAASARAGLGVGAALVRAACVHAEAAGALRFDATVQTQNVPLFTRLGWSTHEPVDLHGRPHRRLEWPVARVRRLVAATKQPLGGLLVSLTRPGEGFLGDDGAPVPGSDLVAACDAIVPAMVERDPEWAGWCSVLVNLNDLFAMGAAPVGLLDAVAARDASFARRVLRGLADAAAAYDVAVLGGHTQLGVPAALSVTALGRTDRPVPGGGGRAGQRLSLTADLGGGWRPGYTGAQWDSTSHRTPAELRALREVVPALRPAAAKDVSMAGVVGTTGMLAEASGCRAVLDVADVVKPAAATTGDWLTCFPGFAMVTADARPADLPGFVSHARCGELVEGSGVGLRWPDGVVTEAVGAVTGLGPAA
ncbi:AIR synthase [Nocardioides mangrovicus]|uniref:AIR synthase n=1 Tax=Nocardioides mangrovicus TaxID=2478913 RepID=A0A3L8P6I3_9ACTN|nr:MSMEG_0567/sll0787 family protein [Nocardioides mangrovicus]RLV50557.1 AIR synthase [Nocardioides mangrovicus]